ncbi:M20/M25/M40 family metallo-hydrolase [Actinomadura violacea]|uniref:M20/M25/M40 family metallo-hydrolase n=1 Tax=Actinomadura violacea TaxID=2819934 RepID=A0ABS3RVD3_9ACTN|nr:M20/M25/M40 family metallo-hydrolase [Actinomadura violacea]MBO2460715.1 M20/M25/M40 family metallo-hydrolase [Actinomadura violacea]
MVTAAGAAIGGNALLSAAGAGRDRYLARLAALVGVDSGTADVPGVNRAARLVAGYARESGLEAEERPLADGRTAVVARRRGTGRARIVLAGHLDTVFPAGTAAERPFRVDGALGRAHGPGVCDDKGGLLAGIAAVETLIALGAERYGEIVLVCSPDEETGSPLGRAVLEAEARGAAAALCLEGARENGDLVSARSGVTDLEITLRGRAAHAGIEPGRGANAALAAARLTVACQALNGSRPGAGVNVGVLAAGSAPNVVAASGRLVVDVRADRAAAFDAMIADIRRLAAEHGVPGVAAEVTEHAPMPPWERGEATARLVGQAVLAGGTVGVPVRDAATGGGADANLIAALGVPVLDGLGPVGGCDHAPGEWLDLASVVPRTALLAALIDRVAGA